MIDVKNKALYLQKSLSIQDQINSLQVGSAEKVNAEQDELKKKDEMMPLLQSALQKKITLFRGFAKKDDNTANSSTIEIITNKKA